MIAIHRRQTGVIGIGKTGDPDNHMSDDENKHRADHSVCHANKFFIDIWQPIDADIDHNDSDDARHTPEYTTLHNLGQTKTFRGELALSNRPENQKSAYQINQPEDENQSYDDDRVEEDVEALPARELV